MQDYLGLAWKGTTVPEKAPDQNAAVFCSKTKRSPPNTTKSESTSPSAERPLSEQASVHFVLRGQKTESKMHTKPLCTFPSVILWRHRVSWSVCRAIQLETSTYSDSAYSDIHRCWPQSKQLDCSKDARNRSRTATQTQHLSTGLTRK
jgi:hypothetical protein